MFCLSIFLFLFQATAQQVRINEFMALNETFLADDDGDFTDWIELYNYSSSGVDLEGWSLTDNKADMEKWVFPDVSIPAGGYLVVFASGKNRIDPSGELHTGFKLEGAGEYLALVSGNGIIVTEFSPAYPAQTEDQSWGYLNGGWVSFTQPSPGFTNENSSVGSYSPPTFSHGHGFYSSPFSLTISTPVTAGEIYYSLDGSAPSKEKGIRYSSPVSVTKTTILRAVVYANGQPVTGSATRTYLFVDDIIHQSNTPAGYPDQWGPYVVLKGNAPADYEMDPEIIQDPQMAERVKNALRHLPVISLVSDIGHFFSLEEHEERGGIYIYTGPPMSGEVRGVGDGWERPVSMEFFDAGGENSLQVNCGVRLLGGHSRRPEKSPKHSFRLLFKRIYGPGRLNYPILGNEGETSFNTLVLRAGFGNSWVHWTSGERIRAHNARDTWSKDTQREMGHLSSRSIYVHLFVNGIYWGIYNPSERPDADYAEQYMGGSAEEYDVIKDYGEVIDGDKNAWNRLHQQANLGLKTEESYWKIQGKNPDGTRNPAYESLVDVDNLIDYMMLNFYGGNTDWDHHNWIAIRNRVNPGAGFKFFCQDQEHVVKSVNENTLNENNPGCPSAVFQRLRENNTFKRRFADKVQIHCFGNGALTPQTAADRWMKRSLYLEGAIDAESARWGDYRRDVHRYAESGPFDLYTKEKHWLPARENVINNYFPNRTANFLGQLRDAGLFPGVIAPEIKLNNAPVAGKYISAGDKLSLSTGKGDIYYSLNGTDPVVWAATGTWKGSVAGDAQKYTGTIGLNQSAHVKARTLYNGEWSALQEAFFVLASEYYALKITEINYHPEESNDGTFGSSDYEFIEIKNTGNSTLNLEGVRFVDGITYTFPVESTLSPGGFIVLASNEEAFYSRYGFIPFGEFNGQLSNSGEWLVVTSPLNDTLCSFSYSDGKNWPQPADGGGNTLVPVDLNPKGDQNTPAQWRASYQKGGSPGQDDLLNDVIAYHQNSHADVFSLWQNYPNPFSSKTLTGYRLYKNARVTASVYNQSGQKVDMLVDMQQPAGSYEVEWNGSDQSGNPLPNGLYLCRFTIHFCDYNEAKTIKMMLVR